MDKKQVNYHCKSCNKLEQGWLYRPYFFLEEKQLCPGCFYGFHQGESVEENLWKNIDNLQGGWNED